MKKRASIIRSILGAVIFACVLFTVLIVWTHYRGGYQFWDSLYLAGVSGIVMGIYSYWKLRRKRSDENGDPSKEAVLLKEHPLLVRSIGTGLGIACAVFTFLIVLAHFRGAYEFWEVFYMAVLGGVAASIEGYRRALRKRNDEESAVT